MIRDYTDCFHNIISLYGNNNKPLKLSKKLHYYIDYNTLNMHFQTLEHKAIKSVKHLKNKQFGEYVKVERFNGSILTQQQVIDLVRLTLERYGGYDQYYIEYLPILVLQ